MGCFLNMFFLSIQSLLPNLLIVIFFIHFLLYKKITCFNLRYLLRAPQIKACAVSYKITRINPFRILFR
jgi:hypothetical protein